MEHNYLEATAVNAAKPFPGAVENSPSLWERIWRYISQNCRLNINGIDGSASLYVRTPKGKDFQILLSEGKDRTA